MDKLSDEQIHDIAETIDATDFMERFVDEVIPEGKLKQNFWRTLSRSHPFRNFNDLIHNCDCLED
jgi:hypothetical protein